MRHSDNTVGWNVLAAADTGRNRSTLLGPVVHVPSLSHKIRNYRDQRGLKTRTLLSDVSSHEWQPDRKQINMLILYNAIKKKTCYVLFKNATFGSD